MRRKEKVYQLMKFYLFELGIVHDFNIFNVAKSKEFYQKDVLIKVLENK